MKWIKLITSLHNSLPGSWYSRRCSLTNIPPKHCCGPSESLMALVFPNCCDPPPPKTGQCTTNTFRNDMGNMSACIPSSPALGSISFNVANLGPVGWGPSLNVAGFIVGGGGGTITVRMCPWSAAKHSCYKKIHVVPFTCRRFDRFGRFAYFRVFTTELTQPQSHVFPVIYCSLAWLIHTPIFYSCTYCYTAVLNRVHKWLHCVAERKCFCICVRVRCLGRDKGKTSSWFLNKYLGIQDLVKFARWKPNVVFGWWINCICRLFIHDPLMDCWDSWTFLKQMLMLQQQSFMIWMIAWWNSDSFCSTYTVSP